MEDEKKRWSVTYTKHIKQKRKVYQDGFLDVHSSSNKVMLYDDCEKLLECRILTKDEVVSSGETLTFTSYLVDVGDPEGDHKPLSNLKFQTRDKGLNHKPGFIHGKKFKNSSISSEDGKPNVERNKAPLNSLSPTQKIIREFKKSDLHKYGAQQSSPDIAKPSITEWQVLYTTQLTKKAKKYHDGFLQLAARGSLGRQVMLFDANRKQLDSRFLKKDEVLRSDESIALDGHLVEIGECEGNPFQGDNGSIAGKMEISHGQLLKKSEVHMHGAPEFGPDTTKYSMTEWEVMYTTQVTQKAKKYHDGFLRLANGGSLGRQAMLYDASKKVLSSRFLKKDEVIRSGESFTFDTHLVDIGEPKENNQQSKDLNVQENNRSVIEKTRILHERQNCLKADRSVVKAKPQNNVCSRGHADSNFGNSKPIKGIITNKPLRDAHQILSVLQKPMVQESIANGCSDKSIMRPVSSVKELQDSDATKDFPEDSLIQIASVPLDGSSGNAETGESSETTPSGSQFSKDNDTANSRQSQLGNVGAFAFGISRSSAAASNCPVDDERKGSEEPKSAKEMDECPSFDLGF